MRFAFLLLVILHALIHVLGFVKGFEIREVNELSLPISRNMGILWLTAAVVLLTFGGLNFTGNRYAWALGLLGVILSQILVIYFWSDAKFGTIPNILILVVSVMAFGSYRFGNMVERETSQLLSGITIPGGQIISEEDMGQLPVAVQHWLRRSGVIGQPHIEMGRVEQRAKMKMDPDQDNWMNAEAWQYTRIDEPSFIWTTRARMNGLVYFLGRDKFVNGQGEMLIKINSLVNIVNERGEKLDEGSMQRYLGEMVWFPSLALSPYVQWESIDNTTVRATIEYEGTSGSGIFYFDGNGDFTRFSAQRYMGNEEDAEKHEWVLLVEGYRAFEGIRVPSELTATWKLDSGDWTWLRLEVTNLEYNVSNK